MSPEKQTPETPDSREPKTLHDVFEEFEKITLGSDDVTRAEAERKKVVDEMLAQNAVKAAFGERVALMDQAKEGDKIDPDVKSAIERDHLEAQAALQQLLRDQAPEEPPTTV